MYETLITNGVTIFIALLAGIVALHQVKLNVVSAARIKWIENLRETLSQYCTELEKGSLIKANYFDERKCKTEPELDSILRKFYDPYKASSSEVFRLQSKIILYLNSKNQKHKEIERLLQQNSHLLHDFNGCHVVKIRRNTEQIIRISKDIFEIEWEKSRKLFKI